MEAYFAERAAMVKAADGSPDPEQLDALRIKYGMEFADEDVR